LGRIIKVPRAKYQTFQNFSVPYLGFMPEREASLPRGELSLFTGFQSIRGFRTGDMTEIV